MKNKRQAAPSLAEMMAAPEGVWFEVPEGLDVSFRDDSRLGLGSRLVVPLSRSVAQRMRPRRGEALTVRLVRGNLVVERRKKGASK